MQKKSVFTFLKKTNIIGVFILLTVFLAGCSGSNSANSSGWFHEVFVDNFSALIKFIAEFFNDNYGLSIIIITIAIRLVVMPFMIKQTKNNLIMQDKMKELKPEMDEIQKKYKDKKDPESQRKMQAEMMQLYQKHNFNPLASFGGCLPVLIQFPFLIGFYYAIRQTPEIATHTFLWFNLGERDMLMIAIAVIVYFIQYKVSQIGLDPKMKKQMAIIGLMSPIMIGVISLNTFSALPLYWTVGGIIVIIQTLISKRIYLAHKREIEQSEKK
ncbi:membrane protein insertase YidC [Ornithinibacillus bavariensis]|uniref:Membrane protein insertase YidC n=1 Tax=Ornithinibacillus bavariensis TaxID=545502 RepID=A0A919XBX7_9BACI|nr:membrane protein insertase YidC [Ornithinibacillus bavariensis]GIO27845.1 membrane protein insertase YidC 1 [Ornithinibacillus bavariensis]